MKQADFRRFAVVLTGVADLYGRTVSEAAMALWWSALERFDLDAVEVAFRRAIEDTTAGQYMPRPADIIRVIEGSAADRSLIAWGKLLDAMRRVGAYQSVVFDDGAIHAAVTDMGGWPALCRSKADDLQWTQKRFCELHRAYAGRPEASYPARLAGDHELNNSASGHVVPPPVLIGNPDAAQTVQALGCEGSKTRITRDVAGVRLIGNNVEAGAACGNTGLGLPGRLARA